MERINRETRNKTIDLLSEAFGRDLITEKQLEEAVRITEGTDSPEDLYALLSVLPEDLKQNFPLPRTDWGTVLKGSHQRFKPRSPWLPDSRLKIVHKHSRLILDLWEIEPRGIRELSFDLTLRHSTCILRLPEDTQVIDRLEKHHSVVRVSRRMMNSLDTNRRIVLTGVLHHSVIRIKP